MELTFHIRETERNKQIHYYQVVVTVPKEKENMRMSNKVKSRQDVS